jgi:SAM-dependent methyltransferase
MDGPQPSLTEALRTRWSDDAPRLGRWRTAGALARALLKWLLDFHRARRRYLFGDLDYDFDTGMNTTAGTVGHRARLHAALLGVPYMPTDRSAFDEMMRALAIDHHGFTFLDIGSGKGRALLLAGAYPFRRIVGVEIVPELHQAAEANIRQWRARHPGAPEMATMLGDARTFDFPPEPLVVYLFNPLPEAALEALLARLERSLAAHPRAVYLVYYNLVLEPVLARNAAFKKIAGTHQWAIYTNAT